MAAVKAIAPSVVDGTLSAGNTINFHTPLFGVPECPSTLYIRHCYVILTEHVLLQWKSLMVQQNWMDKKAATDAVCRALMKMGSTTSRNTVEAYRTKQSTIGITGTPGIGKRSFIAYLAVVCHSARIVFQYKGSFAFGTMLVGNAAIDEDGNISEYFNDTERCVSAYDHDAPGGSRDRMECGYSVFVSSPSAARMKYFVEQRGPVYYLPIWRRVEKFASLRR